MDPNDIDQTQAIFFEEADEDDGTDELLPQAERQPKGFLKVLFQKGLTEKSYPVYEGENVIGRNAGTCHVCIPSKALSKEHACIEIFKDSHLIYDKGSRNKTKRGKLFLSPNVRYELKGDDEIFLADIRCMYIKHIPDCPLDGSDTDGSESFLLQMDVSKDKNTSALSTGKASMFDVVNDSTAEDRADKTKDGDDSLLQPTQTFAKEKAGNPALCVQETPEREHVKQLSTVVLSESESDDEEKVGHRRPSNPLSRSSTGSAVLCAESDSSIDSEKFCMATQAYFPDTNNDKKSVDAPSPNNRNKPTSSEQNSDKLTQVCAEEEATQACLIDEPTQAFLQKDDGEKSSNVAKSSAEIESSEGTQSFDPKSEDVAIVKSENDDAVLKSTQVFEEEEEDDENEDPAGLFAMATMAPDDFADEGDEEDDVPEQCDANDTKSTKQSTNSDATLPVSTNLSEAPTQACEEMQKKEQKSENNNKISLQGNNKQDKTQVVIDTIAASGTVDINCSSANTSPGKSKFSKKSTSEETATFVVEERENISDIEESGNDSKTTAGTLAYGDADPDTQPYGTKTPVKSTKHGRKSPVHTEDATQAYGNDVEDEMETQQFEEDGNLKAGERNSSKGVVCNADEPTQAYESDDNGATQAFEQEEEGNNATQTISLDEPTQRVALDEPTQKIGFDEPTQRVAFDEPTQKVTFDEPTQEVNFDEPTQKVTFEPTQKVAMGEPTQKFDFPNETVPLAGSLNYSVSKRDSRKEENSTSEDDSDLEEKSMLKTDDVLDNEATQVFDMKPPLPGTVNNEIQPTLKYNMEAEEEATSGKENIDKQIDEVQPTLKYDMEVEEKSSKENVSASAEKQASSSSTAADSECYSYPLSPCLEDIGKDGSDDDSEMTPHDIVTRAKSPLKSLPACSPLKSALVDRKRSPSPSPKHVAFIETAVEIPSKETNVSSRSRRPLRTETLSGKGKDQKPVEENKEIVCESSPSKPGKRKSKAIQEMEATDEIVKDKVKKAAEGNVATVRRGRRKKGTNIVINNDTDEEEKKAEPLPSSDANETDDTAKDKEKNVVEETSRASKRGRRKVETANTKEIVDKEESGSETLSSKKSRTTDETAEYEKKESMGTSRRGKRKRGAVDMEDEEKMKTETLPSTDLSDTSKDFEKQSEPISEEPGQEKTSKKKALNSQRISDFASEKPSASKAGEGYDIKSTKNKEKLPKSSRSNGKQDIDESKKVEQIADSAPEANESVEGDNSTRRSRRRTLQNSMFKDFETGGMKKKDSFTKQVGTQDKKAATSPVQGNEDGDDEAHKIKKMELECNIGNLAAPAVLPAKRKRKIEEVNDDVKNQSETTQEVDGVLSTSKRSTRDKRLKPNNTMADGAGKQEMSVTSTAPNKKRSVASAKMEIEKPSVSGKDDLNDKNLKDKKEEKETPSHKKGARKRGILSKGQAEETRAQETQKIDQVTAESETEETPVVNVQSKKRGRNSSKATGKESQQSQASVPRKRRGAAATTAVSDKEDTPVIKGSQDSNQGKRKKTSSQIEDEISCTPSKRSRPSATSVISSPVLRHSTVDSKPKVMFTGVIDEQGEKTVKELGGELVTNIHECSHLVTDKIRRTVKFLGGLAKGVFIVSQQWLDNSKRAGTFLDGQKYLVKDQEMEKQFKFNLANSIASSKKHSLLSGFQIHVSKSVKPDPNQMRDILLCAGAGVLTKMPTKSAEKTVVISCLDDEKLCKAAIKAGIPIVTAEFVLTGILRQNIDLDTYRLFQ